jgi:tetratricopeptide (TPR) repeat protein
MSHSIGTLSPVDAGLPDFKECLKHLRDGHPDVALLHASRALGISPKNPFYLSYAGLLVAFTERRFGRAETLCLEALRIRRNHPQLYLNLAEVYQNAGRPQEAIEVLDKGLALAGRDFRIRRAREQLGARRQPMLPSLSRSHPLNRILGKWRHRLMGSQTA